MASRFLIPRVQFLDGNGDPYAGALLYFYETGTTTALDTYSNNALTVANTNPVVADANGRFGDIFLKAQDYKAVLKTSGGTTIWTADPIHGKGLVNVVDDTAPQLGGDLDANGKDIQFDDGTGIRDDSDNETLIFGKTATAINYAKLSNAAAGGGPTIETLGGDTNVDLNITTKGTGAVNLQDTVLQRPTVKDYGETVNNIGDFGGGAQAIDLTLGNVVLATVSTGAVTFTFTNPSATGIGCSFTLILTNGGSQVVNWPGAVDWAGAAAPSLTAAGVDVVTFATVDAGTTWYGFAAGLDMS